MFSSQNNKRQKVEDQATGDSFWKGFLSSVRPLKRKRRMEEIPPRVSIKKRSFVPLKKGLSSDLDLHGMVFDDAFTHLSDFILAHHAEGTKNVLVITGKGRGEETLSTLFPKWMKNPVFSGLISRIEVQNNGGAYRIYFKRGKRNG